MIFVGHYFDNYRLTDVTDVMVEQAQQELNVTLPKSYVALIFKIFIIFGKTPFEYL